MEKLPILIHRFYTVYDQDPKTKLPRERDMVEYGPIGSAGRSHTVERMDIILSVKDDAASGNPAMMAAKVLRDFIKPRYDAWKSNQELPESGTPLAAWNHLQAAQAEVLRVNGVRSVEDVALLTDTHYTRIPIPNLRSIVEAAKQFLASKDVHKASAEMALLKDENEALKLRVDQLAQMMAEAALTTPNDHPRKPGRPRKAEAEAA
jgi:hypothetical protein